MIKNMEENRMSSFSGATLMITGGTGSVSYTHLDVYKRQVI